MTVSGMFGSVEATRSPGWTPSSRSRVARARTLGPNSSQYTGVTGTVSEWKYSATSPGASVRMTFCA